jgi:hypothetical protein
LVGEEPYFLAENGDCADQLIPFDHWDTCERSHTFTLGDASQRVVTRIISISRHIGDLDGRLCPQHATEPRTRRGLYRRTTQALHCHRRGCVMRRDNLKRAIIQEI